MSIEDHIYPPGHFDGDVPETPTEALLRRCGDRIAGRMNLNRLDAYDVRQAAATWLLYHPVLVDESSPKALEIRVTDYMRAVAQERKAWRAGYSVDDIVYYSPRVIQDTLPLIMDVPASLVSSAAPDEGSGSGAPNPHGQGDFIASLVDVSRAWHEVAFRQSERQLIEKHYINGVNIALLGAMHNLSFEEVERQLRSGVRRMVEFLGGFRGKRCGVDCVECGGLS